MQSNNDNAPHSVGFWLRWEIHERKSNGQLSGLPKDFKDYRGALHCENREDAKEIIQGVIERLTEDLKQCQQKLQFNNQKNMNPPE